MAFHGGDYLRWILNFALPGLVCDAIYRTLTKTWFVRHENDTIFVDSSNFLTNFDAVWDEVDTLMKITPDRTRLVIYASVDQRAMTRDGMCTWTEVIDTDLLDEWCNGIRYDRIVLQYDMR